ncbi:MAG: MFS transporter [Candidatus Aminicenantes bacterium RBG_13_62_12]|nr:MAG: MFS transporter [Candidatus Aminicenantes bacterium RBG_13_62_12]
MSLRNTFLALKHRNYRLYFWGQMVSLFGTWMQITAQGFLAFELTRSAAFLGVLGFATGAPTLMFMLYGGVVADRLDKRKLMLVTQTVMTVLAAATAVLTFIGIVRPWHLILLALGFGAANAFDAPARQSIVVELVEREDLTNAIALNSTMFNAAAVVGPALAGALYALAGPGWCFALNGLSFFAVIAALLAMKLRERRPRPGRASAWGELKEGISYALGHPVIRALLGLIMATSLFGSSFATLFPAWAVKVLGRDAAANGLLHAARGGGALLSALLIASLGRFQFRGRLLALGSGAFPLFLVLFAFVRWFPLTLLALVGAGIAVILVFNLANALIQSLVDDKLRGRVMSLYSLTFFGFMPLGALWIGQAAQRLGETWAVVINAAALLAVSLGVWASTPSLREQK